jgi:SAM-dependent methyltransferase
MATETIIPKSSCRFCHTPLTHTFVDLGMSPLCQDHVKPNELKNMEPFYPLHAYVCEKCFLVQVEEFVSPEVIYDDYAYFSSYSDSWLQHCKRYAENAVTDLKLGPKNLVVELASNDGYLLQYFHEKNNPVLGVEPAATAAERAISKGIRTEVEFFGNRTVGKLIDGYGKADLIIGNNVLAHVPDINDFVSAMKVMLKQDGVITMEFPHLLRLVEGNQFDTIYHEHFSYLSFTTVESIFAYHGLTLVDVEELPTHGGSIRIYARHAENAGEVKFSVTELRTREEAAGMKTLEYYQQFAENVKRTKRKILQFLIDAKQRGKTVAGYGAPGKGNTLLNYCGIRTDFIDYTVDRNPKKQGNFLPGTLIPILSPEEIKHTQPDYLFILPWNLKDEIIDTHSYIEEWGGKFVVPIPEPKVYEPRKVAALADATS